MAQQVSDGLTAAEVPKVLIRLGQRRGQQPLLRRTPTRRQAAIGCDKGHLCASLLPLMGKPIATVLATHNKHLAPQPRFLCDERPQCLRIELRRAQFRGHDLRRHQARVVQRSLCAWAIGRCAQSPGPQGAGGSQCKKMQHGVGAHKHHKIKCVDTGPGAKHRAGVSHWRNVQQGQGNGLDTARRQTLDPLACLRQRSGDDDPHGSG